MASPNVLNVDDLSFEKEVLQSTLPVLVDFWAVWCGPCRQVSPIVESIADDNEGRLKVVKLNIDYHPITTNKYGIRSIPTLLLFKDGEVVEKVVGALPRTRIEETILHHI